MKKYLRIVYKLTVLFILTGALLFVTTDTSTVKADDYDNCDTQYGYCIYQCATLQGQAFETCRGTCALSFEGCDPEDDPPPAPYPIFDTSFATCLQGCAPCTEIEDPGDRLACYMPCWNYCSDRYPKPR